MFIAVPLDYHCSICKWPCIISRYSYLQTSNSWSSQMECSHGRNLAECVDISVLFGLWWCQSLRLIDCDMPVLTENSWMLRWLAMQPPNIWHILPGRRSGWSGHQMIIYIQRHSTSSRLYLSHLLSMFLSDMIELHLLTCIHRFFVSEKTYAKVISNHMQYIRSYWT